MIEIYLTLMEIYKSLGGKPGRNVSLFTLDRIVGQLLRRARQCHRDRGWTIIRLEGDALMRLQQKHREDGERLEALEDQFLLVRDQLRQWQELRRANFKM